MIPTYLLPRALMLVAWFPLFYLSAGFPAASEAELDVQDPEAISRHDSSPGSFDPTLYQNSSADLEVSLAAGRFAFQDPLPARHGTPPLFHSSPPPFLLLRRQCLENGSNFCFDNGVDSCPACRACCTSGSAKWCCDVSNSVCCEGQRCCPSGGTCCGTGCCTGGSTCRNGKCESTPSVITITTTNTVRTVSTLRQTQVKTVVVNVIETSTVNEIITSTITSAGGTQTDVIYVTTTARSNQKRLLGDSRRDVMDSKPAKRSPLIRRAIHVWRTLVFGPGGSSPFEAEAKEAGLWKRQGSQAQTTTLTVLTTLVSYVTNLDSATSTVFQTSTSLITVSYTRTSVINAAVTITTTSTITVTSKPPTTVTHTTFQTVGETIPTGINSPGDPSQQGGDSNTNSSDDGGLSTGATVGIALGTAAAAIFVAAVLFCIWRRRRRAASQQPTPYMSEYPTIRSPQLPNVFTPSPNHHAAAYDPASHGAADLGKAAYGGAAAAAAGAQHKRSLSHTSGPSYSSGQASPATPDTRFSQATGSTVVAEMPDDSYPRYELDNRNIGTHLQPPPPQQQMRTIPHPSTSTISNRLRMQELEGSTAPPLGGGRTQGPTY